MTCRLRDLNYDMIIKGELLYRRKTAGDTTEARWIPI